MTPPTDVLFVAYYFPPVGGAGVQRSLKFARYLPDEGFRPIVVTGPDGARGRWEPADASLTGEVDPALPVYRPPGGPPDRGGSRAARLLGRPSATARWWQDAILDAGAAAAARHDPRLIYISLAPYEGLEPALTLGHTLGLPVVADLRDPWALDEVRIYPTRWHRARELRLMRRRLARCARVIMNTPAAADALLRAFPELAESRVTWIPNGYDAADFAELPPRPAGDRFRIVHTGYLHTAMGRQHRARGVLRRALGGERFAVDFLPRSHVYLLDALERLLRERPNATSKVDLVLAGVMSDADRDAIRASGVAHLVQVPGYVEHHESVRLIAGADLLFLPMHDVAPGERASIVPGKTYEYLASGRPILAALPPGDARDFVEASGRGTVVAPGDAAGMARAISDAMDAAPAPARPIDAATARFERRALTARLAETFRSVLGTTAPRELTAAAGR